jgi:uncharacterized protein YihD (DUF1040 family)
MDNQEKEKLKEWAKRFFSESQIGFDLFDFDNEIDNKLSIGENKTILREKFKVFFNEFSVQQISKKKEAKIMSNEQHDIMITSLKKEFEQQAQLEFITSLKKITEQKGTELLNKKFWLLNQYIKMVCSGNATGLIIEGEAGLGKSYNVLKTLNDEKKDFVYCSGFTTTLELYNFLYENRKKIIFFDDTKNIFKNEASLELLKAGLFSPSGTRIIRYLSTTTKLKAPNQFIFEGAIIIAVNDMGRFNEDLKAVVDRVLYYNVRFSYAEKLQILADLIKQDYKELPPETRGYIFNWLKDNTSEATSNLNFRLLYKLYEIYRFNKADFPKLAKEIVRTDEQQELIIQLLKKHNSVKSAQEEWCDSTGMSRISFYRAKREVS